MRRIAAAPRAEWRKKVEQTGLSWNSGEQFCWNESALYEFTAGDIETIKSATEELERMTLHAIRHVVENRLYTRMGIPPAAAQLIESSWRAESPSIYGRFDLAFDGVNPPKLLEYNADVPTSLVEAAVTQAQWLEEAFPARAQFNSIRERLVAAWKDSAPYLPGRHVDFCSLDSAEDRATVKFMLETAREAGLTVSTFGMAEIGWNGSTFVGPDERPLGVVFKLYPWDWMVREEFGKHLASAGVWWIEPPWKMLLSNRGLLAALWDLYPRHPNLLHASLDGPSLMMRWVRKPTFGREGSGVTIHEPGRDIETPHDREAEAFVCQDHAPLINFDGVFPVIGSWTAGHEAGRVAAGIGVRESALPIATDASQFVPHLLE